MVVITSSLSFVCFISIVLSYFHMVSTALKMLSTKGEYKDFCPRVPHPFIIVFCLFVCLFQFGFFTLVFPLGVASGIYLS